MKYLITAILVMVLAISYRDESQAEEQLMPDGTYFDAEYFAKTNPNIVSLVGSDCESLFRYYSRYGRMQGMKAYDDGERCLIIIGDSRVCGLLCSFMRTDDIETVSTSVSGGGKYMSGIFKDGDLWMVLSGEMSGRLSRDSYDNSVKTVKNIISHDVGLGHIKNYTFVNMYGINDLYHNLSGAMNYPSRYMAKNKDIYNNFDYCDRAFQLNVGPIDERGIVYKRGFRNQYIETYNTGFVSDDEVTVIDLYDFLISNGFNGILDVETTDHTGLHYDDPTNLAIYGMIKEEVMNQPSSALY